MGKNLLKTIKIFHDILVFIIYNINQQIIYYKRFRLVNDSSAAGG
jgi:hypothetical protein